MRTKILALALAICACAAEGGPFFYKPGDGVKPLALSGDQHQDWLRHALEADVCVADEIPPAHILSQWRRLGVKMLKRVRYDQEDTAEYYRRKVGFLPVRDDADGVWLEGAEKMPEAYKAALAEARIDSAVARYARELAEQAYSWRAQGKDNKVWIEGRRVKWFFEFMDFERENLDTLRLEFICYAKRLEQLLGLPGKKLPVARSKPFAEGREKYEPLAGKGAQHVPVNLECKSGVELGEGVKFFASNAGFAFEISSKNGKKDVWPGGAGTVKFYLPDGTGSYMPYEYFVDLSPIEPGERAPTDCYGLWFLEERWGKGKLHLYSAPGNWRLRPVPHGSYGSKYPKLVPRFNFRWNDKGEGWTLRLEFGWLSTYGFWPSMKNGIVDKWYFSTDALADVPALAVRLDWAKGRELNFKKLASGLGCQAITERYEDEKALASGIYHLWYEERLYGFAKTKEPTYQRCDAESDKMFWERVVEPMMDANKPLADFTYAKRQTLSSKEVVAKLTKATDQEKMSAWKALGKLFDLADRVSVARRDYILMRYAGKTPPEPPPKKPKEGAAAVKAPDIDNDDNALQLDDKEF